ncbi:MAG: M24 family metallopeptidase, partial [Planctomycetota bacterium]|nr:M24 family metallopeptidase [Planctomycetota bacterium]
RVVQTGDLVSLDTGCRLAGWCGDAAVTHAVGAISETDQKLLDVTQGTLNLALELMSSCKLWSQVAREMEAMVKDSGFHVVEEMVGHGIGQNLHEPPQVPNYFSEALAGSEDFDLRPGVVLAIEPMVNLGTREIVCLDDGWTLVTEDGQASAHFEHTIAITAEGPQRLTGPPTPEELSGMPDWLQETGAWVTW